MPHRTPILPPNFCHAEALENSMPKSRLPATSRWLGRLFTTRTTSFKSPTTPHATGCRVTHPSSVNSTGTRWVSRVPLISATNAMRPTRAGSDGRTRMVIWSAVAAASSAGYSLLHTPTAVPAGASKISSSVPGSRPSALCMTRTCPCAGPMLNTPCWPASRMVVADDAARTDRNATSVVAPTFGR